MLSQTLQTGIARWIIEIFGWDSYLNKNERAKRFLEEAIELNQAMGVSQEDALRLVNHVYSKPVGDVEQELGGVGITLLALGSALSLDVSALTLREYARISALPADHFRKRQAIKAEAGVAMKVGAPNAGA